MAAPIWGHMRLENPFISKGETERTEGNDVKQEREEVRVCVSFGLKEAPTKQAPAKN